MAFKMINVLVIFSWYNNFKVKAFVLKEILKDKCALSSRSERFSLHCQSEQHCPPSPLDRNVCLCFPLPSLFLSAAFF